MAKQDSLLQKLNNFVYDTLWLTQKVMAELFDTTKENISMHLKNIFIEGELEESATVKEILTVQKEAGRNCKSL